MRVVCKCPASRKLKSKEKLQTVINYNNYNVTMIRSHGVKIDTYYIISKTKRLSHVGFTTLHMGKQYVISSNQTKGGSNSLVEQMEFATRQTWKLCLEDMSPACKYFDLHRDLQEINWKTGGILD